MTMAIDFDNLDDDDDRPKLFDWQHALSILLLLAGIGLVAWSFLLSDLAGSRAAWTKEQALAYQSASARLHGLSHEAIHASGTARQQTVEAELNKAQTEFNGLRSDLESAMARSTRLAWLLRIGGVLLLVAGGGILFLPSHSADKA
jgi:hypothetical protein